MAVGAGDRALAAAEDQRLIAALADGEVDALSALFARHGATLLALARRIVGEEAEDLVHDVFVEVWRHAATYDPARASVRTWMIVRCRSRALDRLRSARTRGAVPLDEVDALPALEAAELPRQLDGQRAAAALDQLSPPQREVIALAYYGGLSATEIAAQLEIPVGTVKSRTAAALAALRRWAEPGGAG
jgi:RNA polymerase sigma-70 factor (ECF subfamily)